MFWKGRTVFSPPICLFNSPFRETQSILFLFSLLLRFFHSSARDHIFHFSLSLSADRPTRFPAHHLSFTRQILISPFSFPVSLHRFFLPGKCHFTIYSVWQTSEANLFFASTPKFPNTHGLELFEGRFTTSQC